MISGKFPTSRHDGSEWLPSDKYRANKKGSLGATSGLLQIRGDWAWYKEVFQFPGWSNHQICWKCAADHDDGGCSFKNVHPNAPWRARRYTGAQFWSIMRENGISPHCLFLLPGVTLEMVCIDVLHCLDLGVSQDLIGNVLWEFIENRFVEGSSREKRVKALLLHIKKHQKRHHSQNKLQGLTVDTIKQDKKAPKLRAKGGETRSLMSYALECAMTMNEKLQTVHTSAVLQCVSAQMEFYLLMGVEPYRPDLASAACQKFCSFYSALSKEAQEVHGNDLFWRIKPKLHMYQELAQYQIFQLGDPKKFWNYRDEDYVGWVATIARSKGGPKQAATVARNVLQQHRALAS